MQASLKDQTVLITGATSGIGRITAHKLAGMGAQVVVIGRNPARAGETVADIKRATGNPQVDALVGDLSSMSEVRRMADEFRQRYDRLNILINNAGAIFFRYRLTPDGFENTLALNHLSHFLLTNLLLDLITASAPARIINVSSVAHYAALLNPDALLDSRYARGFLAYGQTKLMNILFARELARRLPQGITANSLHPGLVATNFGRSNGGVFRRMWDLLELIAVTPEEGSKTSIYLASSPEVAGVTGQYFVRCKPVRSSIASYDQDLAQQMWEVSAKLTGLQ